MVVGSPPWVRELCKRLKATYPNSRPALTYNNPLQLLVAAILSAQTTDESVNRVTQKLFQRYKTASDYAQADLAELEKDLRAIGLYRSKARNIQRSCQILCEKYGGEVPPDMEALLSLPGVGRKTANVVLGNGFGRNEGIVVDRHVARLSHRLGLAKGNNPEAIERELMDKIPRELWTDFSNWLIWHGRKRCRARFPDCRHCELEDLCPKIGVSLQGPPEGRSPKKPARATTRTT
ncbi:Endonuclease III [Candidatus Methylacidithermus pantelleriae]|uniref:Endonuclease III n=2 Tax=Candidatus Methylacidithermus pantelleriae TaxID=2744239 RepID=A0A8J2BQP9_9BACT|nr:Endonuclease III [Candidatus Methylacidithermus pantelleriae]